MYYIFFKNDENPDWVHALQRYFKYVLKTELVLKKPLSLSAIDNGVVFVSEQDRDNPSFIEFAFWNPNIRIIVLCFKKYLGRINMISVSDYRQSFQQCIDGKFNNSDLFSKEELRERLSRFIKSHGKESIVSILNKLYYVMNNYSLVSNGIIDIHDYKEKFLTPVLNEWYFTKNRLDTFAPYFLYAGCVDELKLITSQLDIINNFIPHFKSDAFCSPDLNNKTKVESVLTALGIIQNALNNLLIKSGLTHVG